MAKKRIYEIAREHGLSSQDLADRLRAAGLEVKSNLSTVEESEAVRVLSSAAPETGDGVRDSAEPESAAYKKEPAKGKEEAGAPKEGAGTPKDAEKREGRPKKTPRKKRSSRFENTPTVVAPDVPVRKGAKPSGRVKIKGEVTVEPLPEPQQPAAKKEEQTAAEKKSQSPRERSEPSKVQEAPRPEGRGARGGKPRTEQPPRPEGAGPGASRRGGDRRPEKQGAKAEPRTERSRPRRGQERGGRRRVVIDSQAGRKTGRAVGRGVKEAEVAEVDKAPVEKAPAPGTETPVKVPSGVTVKDLADALELAPGEIIKTMMGAGEMVTITQSLADEAVVILAEEYGRNIEIESAEEEEVRHPEYEDDAADLEERAPVVTVMGHVDHGKTSLLDAVRETEVATGEAGGITQHIGAYQVHHKDKQITFVDTPGHEAFTAMRARGAGVTDIAVIVVAANDGVMPQTVEAIDHAKAARVPITVAINKIDVPDANPDRVRQQLAELDLVPEEWGGDTVMVAVSAKQRKNLDELMDMILLVAEMQEIKANPKAPASGVIVESELDVGRGPVATLLVQRGTLRVGDVVLSGESYGRVKAMFDFKGESLSSAGPGMPVQILGFGSVPQAGDFTEVVADERTARHRAESRTARLRMEEVAKGRVGATSLDDFFSRLKEGELKELALVLKGDVGGSVEALQEALENISHPEARVRVIHSGVGAINESDIMLASASNAVVIGFNVRPSGPAKTLAETEKVDVRTYRVIYQAIEEVEAALVGMLEPEQVEEELGSAEVRQVFRSSRLGAIAGCYVVSGKVTRNARVRVVRDGNIVYEGEIGSLKRFQEDVREVQSGYECGIRIEGFDDVKEGDVLEVYEVREVARSV